MKLWNWLKSLTIKEDEPLTQEENNCPNCSQGRLIKWIENTKDSNGVLIRHEDDKCSECNFEKKKEINTGITEADIHDAARTGRCPSCRKSGFKINPGHGGYNSDSKGNIIKDTGYHCDSCDFYCNKEVNTGVTWENRREAKEILKKHGLLKEDEGYNEMLKSKTCPECGYEDWIRLNELDEEIICRHHGLCIPRYLYPGLEDTEDIKKILQNKDSKEKLKEIIDASHQTRH